MGTRRLAQGVSGDRLEDKQILVNRITQIIASGRYGWNKIKEINVDREMKDFDL